MKKMWKLSLILMASTILPVIANAITEDILPFQDVNKNDWFYESVKFAYDNKIIMGYTNTQFAPNDKVTRGQLVTILWRYEGTPDTSSIKNKFSDVPEDDYFTSAVKWAEKNEIIHGYNSKSFGPNDPITRQDLAVILNNYAKYEGLNAEDGEDISTYADYSLVKGTYSEPALKWAVKNKVMSGQKISFKRYISPTDNATRAETAAMVSNYINNTKEVPSIPVTSITLNKTTETLEVNSTLQLETTILPTNATDQTITWSTSNNKVATVTSSGKVTAKQPGTATITATTSNDIKATFELAVPLSNIQETTIDEVILKLPRSKANNVLAMQGVAFSDKYIVYAGYSSDTENTRVTVIDRSAKEITDINNTTVMSHANDVTYIGDDTFVITPGTTEPVLYYVKINDKGKVESITPKNFGAKKYPPTAIGYSSKEQKLIGFRGGYIYEISDDLTSGGTNIPVYADTDNLTHQGMAVYNNYVFFARSVPQKTTKYTFNDSFILVYDLDGNYKCMISLPASTYQTELNGTGHFESLSVLNGEIYMGHNLHAANSNDGKSYQTFIKVSIPSGCNLK